MIDKKNKSVVIQYNHAGAIYFYSGVIVSESDDFITFEDRKEGIIRLNKAFILKIKEETF